jgi:hypothetical protein
MTTDRGVVLVLSGLMALTACIEQQSRRILDQVNPRETWEASPSPAMLVGTPGTELFRVRGAALLSTGRLAVASCGQRGHHRDSVL